jgi:hypothetical protein
MPWFVVYRHGFHESNQSPDRGQPEKMAVARVEASGPDEACRLAAPQATLAAGQRLSAEPAEELDATEAELNRTARTMGSPPTGE